MALLGLLASQDLLLDLNVVLTTLDLGSDQVAAGSDGVHVLCLEQVVEAIQVEALVQELQVDVLGQTHQADGLIFDLGHKGLICVALV